MTDGEAACKRKRADDDHLDDLPDGSGCTEIWEHLSERRERDSSGDEDD